MKIWKHNAGNLNTSVFPVPASFSSISEATCNQSPLCSFIDPVYNDTELGRSSLADRVLQVMAKLPSWHCPIKTHSCVPAPENWSPTLHGQMDMASELKQWPGAPKPGLGKPHSGSSSAHPWHFQARSPNLLQGRCYDLK